MPATRVRLALVAIFAMTSAAVGSDLSTLDRAEQSVLSHDFVAAVELLEPLLSAGRDGDRTLQLLRRAYRGVIRNALAAHDSATAQRYNERLRIIEQSMVADVAAHDGRVSDAPGTGQAGSPVQPAGTAATPDQQIAPRARLLRVRPNTDSPDARAADVGGWLRSADALFFARAYAQAAELYTRVHDLSPAVMTDARERWAYCRLDDVVKRINQPPRSDSEWAAIERETRSIQELVPANARMREYAATLQRIAGNRGVRDEPAADEPVIRANSPDGGDRTRGLLAGLAARIGLAPSETTGRSQWRQFRSGSWRVVERASFRVFHTDDKLGGPAADIAECTRIELYRTWFGHAPQGNWQPKCDIYIHSSAEAYTRVTRQGPASPGHSATGLDRGRIVSRRIDLRADGPDLLYAVLPHEITHVVMADRFRQTPLPRWADEGIAVLTEPPEKKAAHLQNLSDFSERGRLYSPRQIMTMNDYPPGHLWGMFYAESVSLVEFLVSRGGPSQFIEFMERSLASGYEGELKRLYGIGSFDALAQEWGRQRPQQLAAATGQ